MATHAARQRWESACSSAFRRIDLGEAGRFSAFSNPEGDRRSSVGLLWKAMPAICFRQHVPNSTICPEPVFRLQMRIQDSSTTFRDAFTSSFERDSLISAYCLRLCSWPLDLRVEIRRDQNLDKPISTPYCQSS